MQFVGKFYLSHSRLPSLFETAAEGKFNVKEYSLFSGMREFSTLIGAQGMTPVPIENTGGQGTRDGHWRETVFGNELMTGFLNLGQNPLSRLTVGSLEDLGYAVNYTAADPYALPSALALAMMGVHKAGNYGRRQCRMCDASILGTHTLPQIDAH